jgi:hypothetical protein
MRHIINAMCVLFASLFVGGGQALSQESASTNSCQGTAPNGIGPKGVTNAVGYYGNEALSVYLGQNGRTITFKPDGPGEVLSDGSLSMKFQWHRNVPGALTVEGRRLDASVSPMHATVAAGYGQIGVQPTTLTFPTPGCWEITGHLGDASLRFIADVVKIGTGPTGRRTSPPTK